MNIMANKTFRELSQMEWPWRLFCFIMLRIQSESRFARFLKSLSRNGIVALFSNKVFWICDTFVYTDERYKLPGKGGGIYSAINLQRNNWKSIPLKCTDKLAVRAFVQDRIGSEHLVPMVPGEGVFWTNADTIDAARRSTSAVLICDLQQPLFAAQMTFAG